MPIMMEKLYDALRAANAPDDKARAAAVEAAEFATIERLLQELMAKRQLKSKPPISIGDPTPALG